MTMAGCKRQYLSTRLACRGDPASPSPSCGGERSSWRFACRNDYSNFGGFSSTEPLRLQTDLAAVLTKDRLLREDNLWLEQQQGWNLIRQEAKMSQAIKRCREDDEYTAMKAEARGKAEYNEYVDNIWANKQQEVREAARSRPSCSPSVRPRTLPQSVTSSKLQLMCEEEDIKMEENLVKYFSEQLLQKKCAQASEEDKVEKSRRKFILPKRKRSLRSELDNLRIN